ncbi:MAG: ATP-dependent Clp protease ATP-binding subunit [Clostridia bacterium]|nr:ATP-dependent Clp protease ATP-binding subunit [Clostridia bacterium]
MELYDHFSDKAKLILEQAYVEVSEMNMNYVGSEHLLLSLLKVKSDIIDLVKRYNRLTYKDVKKECLRFVGIGLVKREIQGYSRRASEILKQATFEANSLKSLKVEPEHIFLALLDASESTAVKVLEKIGFSAFDVKTDVIRELDFKDKTNAQAKIQSVEGSFLKRFGVNMTKHAKQNKYDQVIGRDEIINRVVQILGRRTKNNPCLVGEPGVGKTAIVEGVANLMISKEVPDYLMGKQLIAVSLGALLAGSKFRGEFEDRLTQLIQEVQNKKDVILFIDEIHTLVGAGATQGAMDASNILKPFLSRDDIQLIGATTVAEYRQYIEKDMALERRLQPVKVDEPALEACEEMLKGIKSRYEQYHQITIEDDAVSAAVYLSNRYMTDRYMPDKAIDLMDEAASRVKLNKKAVLTSEEVKAVVNMWTGIPVLDMGISQQENLLHLEKYLSDHIIGQDKAISVLVNGIMRNKVGLSDHNKPLGSFMFVGQTGVGKTALAQRLSEGLFHKSQNFIRLDMSEYMEKHSVSKMIGSPPGYIAYEEGGQLTEKVRNYPHSVILFDELEKAHPDVIDLLLQILDEGNLTDSKGRSINFKHAIIICTSNVGSDAINKLSIGFDQIKNPFEETLILEEKLKDALKKHFKNEFLNRIDDVVVFNPLTEKDVMKIIAQLMNGLIKRTETLGFSLHITKGVMEKLYQEGYSPRYGVRSLKRSITQFIENPLAAFLLKSSVHKDIRIKLNGKKEIEIEPKVLERADNG